MFPGTNGGPNWGGGSFDPESGVLFVNSMDVGAFAQMVERPGGNPPWRSRSTKWGRFWDSNQYPCQKPPWGRLTAVDLNSGEFRWQSVLGEFDELTARGVAKTGTPNLGGIDRHQGRPGVHCRHQRQAFSRLRQRHRQRAVGRRGCPAAATPRR